jgi:hypothetical protein
MDPDEQKRMRAIPYASDIGSIIYAMICTRPDVSYALSAMSRYQSNYGDAHLTIVKNILKYLRRTKEVFLVFGGDEEPIAPPLRQNTKSDYNLESFASIWKLT